MIKITYITEIEDMPKPETTIIRIFDGRYFAQYSVTGKAQSIVNKMKQDGRKNVFQSRGQLVQFFANKNEDEILEIVKQDIDNGRVEAEKQSKKKVTIKDLVIERI